MRVRGVFASLVVAALCIAGAGARGEAARRDGGGDSARLQMMLQQLNTEKTNLAAENAKLKADLEKSKQEVDAVLKERDAGVQKLGRSAQEATNSQARADATQRSFDTLKSRFDQLVEQFRATVAAMKELEQERDRLETNVSDYDVRVKACERNNDALYQAGLDLIDLYEHKGVFASLMQREPVTKLKRVQMQNMMDQYRQLAEDMHLKQVPEQSSSADAQAARAADSDVTEVSP